MIGDGMRSDARGSEPILYCRQLVTVILANERLAAQHLRKRYGLSYGEYCCLQALAGAGGGQAGSEGLAGLLMLERTTVRKILLGLEDRGCVQKVVSAGDGREMACSLTQKGLVLELQANKSVKRHLACALLASLDEVELARSKMWVTVDALRGYRVSGFDGVETSCSFLDLSFFLYWRILRESWSTVAAQAGFPSLRAYRLLELLCECGAMGAGQAADLLAMRPSRFSLVKRDLIRMGLVQDQPSLTDGRVVSCAATAAGSACVRKARPQFEVATAQGHPHLTCDEALTLNVWYMRMYANLRHWLANCSDDNK